MNGLKCVLLTMNYTVLNCYKERKEFMVDEVFGWVFWIFHGVRSCQFVTRAPCSSMLMLRWQLKNILWWATITLVLPPLLYYHWIWNLALYLIMIGWPFYLDSKRRHYDRRSGRSSRTHATRNFYESPFSRYFGKKHLERRNL